ncbi:MAG: hypothetical protein IPL58_14915 [Betaproteobacteria bacterium]|uniref:Molecular chaperone n=1 Tax=Candidatus Proximibacter danicus TaxID=2954365 RepID=A0A9D7K5X5_9PROT|nr:hypothetical protein [Candidatus Proximibacter danicus]MBK9447172.1 hypothetical protein [Betaproteobacteria bacterium]
MSTIGLPRTNEMLRFAIPDLDTGIAFLSRLPLANPLQAEASLNQFFDSLLNEPPAALTYLSLLEHTRVPLCFVEEELARRYVNKPLPLGEIEEQAFQQVISIWHKVCRAYAQCAQLDADADDPEHPLRVALVLHRCIYYTSMVIVEHHRARRELPPGVWLELNGFYATAEEWGVSIYPLADALDSLGRATHCAAAYSAALLMDLAGPYSLSVRDQSLIRRWAGQWAPLVGIDGAAPGQALPPFVVDLMQDAGLKPVADCLSTENVRRLDTSRLAIVLNQARQQLAQRVSPSQSGLGEDCTAGQCRRLLEHLARPWTQARAARKFKRHATSGIAHVAAGFEAIHYFVSGKEFTQPESTRVYSRQEFDSLFVFRQMADPTAQLQINQERQVERPDEWEVVNQSANGFRLMRSIAGRKVSHGQVLAVCPDDGERYFLAQVTWLMQDRSHGLVAGIAALPGVPQAISARLATGHAGQGELYSRAFLLPAVPAVNPDPSLVLPQGWYQAGRVIEIFSDALWRVRLDHVLQEGPDFERVSFTLDK